MAARAGVEPTTIRLKVIVSTKAPPRPTIIPCRADGLLFRFAIPKGFVKLKGSMPISVCTTKTPYFDLLYEEVLFGIVKLKGPI